VSGPLEAAARDPELRGHVPPVVAAGFGVLPLELRGELLTVACFPRARSEVLAALRRVLDREILATPFEERELYKAIRQAYFADDQSVNFPTFRAPDFLEDPARAVLLRQEKVEALGDVRCDLAPEDLVLASLSYSTSLRSLDLPPGGGGALPDPRRTRLELGDLDTAGWRREGDGWRLHLPGATTLSPAASLVLTEFRHSELRHLAPGSCVGEHETRASVVEELPLVLHATEVQVVGIEADGALVVHSYDQRLRCPPGSPPVNLDLTYYFLSYGSRLQRTIQIRVHEVQRIPRATVVLERSPAPWGPADLARWLGVETE
jgi:hypothetical protein